MFANRFLRRSTNPPLPSVAQYAFAYLPAMCMPRVGSRTREPTDRTIDVGPTLACGFFFRLQRTRALRMQFPSFRSSIHTYIRIFLSGIIFLKSILFVSGRFYARASYGLISISRLKSKPRRSGLWPFDSAQMLSADPCDAPRGWFGGGAVETRETHVCSPADESEKINTHRLPTIELFERTCTGRYSLLL